MHWAGKDRDLWTFLLARNTIISRNTIDLSSYLFRDSFNFYFFQFESPFNFVLQANGF